MPPRTPRADAQRNRDRLLAAAAELVAEEGVQASLRDVARRAEVGLGTLYRHFPTRDDLLEALLGRRFEALAEHAERAERAEHAGTTTTADPERALVDWLQEFTLGAAAYRDLPAALVATLHSPDSALHASCLRMREAGGRLLLAAQEAGAVRPEVTPLDLFALANALGWIADQSPSLAERREHLFRLVWDGLRRR
ncbi:TetR/AcrR family transcriptional regulator [Kitasatospora sp. NPDC051170]|uniref:TetR/AcrR family transcriptional regulator n=1 Tax=Kitasatospora sp. NPDC051170 TaxID=3364056 RepID=UPI00379A756A